MIGTGTMSALSAGGTMLGASPTMGIMREGMTGTTWEEIVTAEIGALQEMAIGITIAGAAVLAAAAEATTAEAAAEAEALTTGGGDEVAAIPAMDTDLGDAIGLLATRGEAPPTAIRTIPRSFPRSPLVRIPPWRTCSRRLRLLLLLRVLRT